VQAGKEVASLTPYDPDYCRLVEELSRILLSPRVRVELDAVQQRLGVKHVDLHVAALMYAQQFLQWAAGDGNGNGRRGSGRTQLRCPFCDGMPRRS